MKTIDTKVIDDTIHQIVEEIAEIEAHKEHLRYRIDDLRNWFADIAIGGMKYTTAWGQTIQFVDGKFMLNGEVHNE
jgi:septation ring formation regulator EzrA